MASAATSAICRGRHCCRARIRCRVITVAPGTTITRARITAGSRSIISGACPIRAASTAIAEEQIRSAGLTDGNGARLRFGCATRREPLGLHHREREEHDRNRLMLEREIDRHLVEQREDAEHALQAY